MGNRHGTCRVFVETVSGRATGATGGFVPSFSTPIPQTPSVVLRLPFSRHYPHPSFSPLAPGCDLKCKLKYSSVGGVVQVDSILMELQRPATATRRGHGRSAPNALGRFGPLPLEIFLHVLSQNVFNTFNSNTGTRLDTCRIVYQISDVSDIGNSCELFVLYCASYL